MLDKQFKAKWLQALRSGEYEQGTGRLKRDNTYCCLGVGADLLIEDGKYGCKWVDEPSGITLDYVQDNGRTDNTVGSLPVELANKIGLSSNNQDRLIQLNDNGQPFRVIADYIDENL